MGREKMTAMVGGGILIIALLAVSAAYTMLPAADVVMDRVDCDSMMRDFDYYAARSTLPISDPDSLCHGMYLGYGSDFSDLEPKWAVGKLAEVTGDFGYSLVLEGLESEVTMSMPFDGEQMPGLAVGRYYRVDMNNICRHFFMMVDSRYPSPVAGTFVKPEMVRCG